MKKQSQFWDGQNGVRCYLKGTYDNITPCRAWKNKAKQSQFAGKVKSNQTIPITIYDNRDEDATQGKLKKQSQFTGGQNWSKPLYERIL